MIVDMQWRNHKKLRGGENLQCGEGGRRGGSGRQREGETARRGREGQGVGRLLALERWVCAVMKNVK